MQDTNLKMQDIVKMFIFILGSWFNHGSMFRKHVINQFV